MSNTLLEKYRPKYYSDIISQQKTIAILKSYTDNNDFPNCILYGTAGIGKTSIIEAAINELFNKKIDLPIEIKNKNLGNTLWINASEERGIKVIDSLINTFIKSKALFNNKLKIIIFDECDNLTPKAQLMIKNYINIYDNVKCCFICNNINKINPSIVARCINFKFTKCIFDDIFKKVQWICLQENIQITDDAIKKIIIKQDNDIRAILNNLHYYNLLYYQQIIFSQFIKLNADINIINVYHKLDINSLDYYKKMKMLYYIEQYLNNDKNSKIAIKLYQTYFK